MFHRFLLLFALLLFFSFILTTAATCNFEFRFAAATAASELSNGSSYSSCSLSFGFRFLFCPRFFLFLCPSGWLVGAHVAVAVVDVRLHFVANAYLIVYHGFQDDELELGNKMLKWQSGMNFGCAPRMTGQVERDSEAHFSLPVNLIYGILPISISQCPNDFQPAGA